MRITSAQVQTTKSTVDRILGSSNRVWLFGSRTDDEKWGGDLDLLIETDVPVANRAETLCRLYGALIMALGDRKLDILIKDARTQEAPIHKIARRTGIRL